MAFYIHTCVCVYYSILCIVGLGILPMVVVGALVFVGIKPVHDSQFSHAYNEIICAHVLWHM